ncbi:MAG: hypothetical protein LKE51_14450 [Selenomonas sp.]|jgi:hypothetical protein|nr:hypothetical protein [Selenomonas sp.]
MGISGIGSGSSTLMSFVQLNQNVSRTGQQASKQVTEQTAAITDVSNFGNETRIGTSKFQQGNKQIVQEGTSKAEAISSKAKSYYEVSNFGNETRVGTSKFQQQLKQIAQQGAENIASGMQKVNNVTTNSDYGNSRFQQANSKIMTARQQASAAYTQAANYKQASAGRMVDFAA